MCPSTYSELEVTTTRMYVKIIFDGALDSRNGIGGINLIMRDHEGFVLVFQVKQVAHVSNSFVVEL